ncbi:HAMP domain-containing sensor histidine kinase [Aminipila terrae]|uniref:histidine kinase n=1 Tax=Aminipila terrae TaxID=2697030 RepID=A0A6P1ML66_9FIRM|nr:HAMP domain-containing sensor histidine kinase [Aminipila terrae]QHI71715.1 GHKL domain-containing protein [Aminipila terrae]
MKNRRIFSLRYKSLLILLLGVAVSFGMNFLIHEAGRFLIDKYYLNSKAVSQRLTDYQESFEKYVDENHISIRNVRDISKWLKSKNDVYLIIYNGDKIIYEAGFWDIKKYSDKLPGNNKSTSFLLDSKTDVDKTELDLSLRDIKFKEGTYSAAIIEFSEIKWYHMVNYISWGLSILFLFVVLIMYNNQIISHIMKLSNDISQVEKGKLEKTIYHKGNDEISLLAMNADNMRNSIITRLQSEKEAWEANSELITSMSHDIRTPLTALIGYLEILDSETYHSEEQLGKYIKRCKEKSIQLKDISDKLFQYFLVFGKEKIEMQMEILDGTIIFQQLLYEHIFDLKNMGFYVEMDCTDQSFLINADIHYLKRMFDNLFSNIEKYARPGGTVSIILKAEDNGLFISIANEVRNSSQVVESTNIGLKSCRKIVEQINGSLEIEKNQECFKVCITIPIENRVRTLSKLV